MWFFEVFCISVEAYSSFFSFYHYYVVPSVLLASLHCQTSVSLCCLLSVCVLLPLNFSFCMIPQLCNTRSRPACVFGLITLQHTNTFTFTLMQNAHYLI